MLLNLPPTEGFLEPHLCLWGAGETDGKDENKYFSTNH